MFKSQYAILGVILLLALVVRLYKIDSPIADWHSWRQVDTAAVTRNFIKEGFNPFLPKGDDMSTISEVNIPNLDRFRLVEFPIYNIAVYPFYKTFGVVEGYHRLVSVLFSLGSIIFLYLLVKKFKDQFTALLSALIFAVLPYSIFFSRVTLPEPTLTFWSLGMMYFISSWIAKNQKKLFWLGAIFGAVAFLIKPWAIFFAIPLLYLSFRKEGKLLLPKKYWILSLLIITPLLLWRLWILNHPEGIPATGWLLNGDGIRFRPSFWWWIISERIGKEILGVTGAFLFFFGLILRPKDGNFFFHIWALSILSYFVIFATGNVRHDYYQIIFIPIASIFVAMGFLTLIKGEVNLIPRLWTILLGLIFLPLTFYFTWVQVKGLYQINNPVIITAGQQADRILPKSAVVAAPYNGDTAFLYHINRPGWPVISLPLTELIAHHGVTHYVSTTKDAKSSWVKRHFLILEEKPDYIIADLTYITKKLDILDPEPQ